MDYVYNLDIEIHMRRLGKLIVIHILNCKDKLGRAKQKIGSEDKTICPIFSLSSIITHLCINRSHLLES